MKESIVTVIKNDLFRHSGVVNVKAFLHYFRSSPGFKFIVYFRIITLLSKGNPIRLIGKWRYNQLTFRYGFQIPQTALLGSGFKIVHFGNLIINSKATIGRNCNIYPGVTIGATFRGEAMGVPTLGNNVWIGTGAVIVGKISIGDNVLIAPNSFLNKSVPENSVVFGNPAIIKSKVDAVDGYILNPI